MRRNSEYHHMNTTTLADAFARAGLPASSVSFAAACRDLARLALNQRPDPRRAVQNFLNLAGGERFRAEIEHYLAAVAVEMKSDAAAGVTMPLEGQLIAAAASNSFSGADGHRKIAANGHRAFAAAPEPAPHSAAEGHRWSALPSQTTGAPAAEPDPAAEGQNERATNGHAKGAPAAGPTPAAAELLRRAKTAGRLRVLSGFHITERQGGRTPIEDIRVGRTQNLLRQLARRAGHTAVECLVVRNLARSMPRGVPSDATYADVFSSTEIVAHIAAAQAEADALGRAMIALTLPAVAGGGPAPQAAQ